MQKYTISEKHQRKLVRKFNKKTTNYRLKKNRNMEEEIQKNSINKTKIKQELIPLLQHPTIKL